MIRIASPERYPPRTCSMTAARVGTPSAAIAVPQQRRRRQRSISEDLEARRLCLRAQQVFHPNLPASRGVVDGDRNEAGGAAFRREHITGVVTDDLAGWIHDVDVKDMVGSGGCVRERDAERA